MYIGNREGMAREGRGEERNAGPWRQRKRKEEKKRKEGKKLPRPLISTSSSTSFLHLLSFNPLIILFLEKMEMKTE